MRIRSIKPEFWRDPDTTGVWPLDEKLVYEGLWTLADDEGRIAWNLRQIRADLFPYPEGALLTRGGPALDLDGVLERLAHSRCLVFYEVDGRRYAWLPNFAKHQRPNKPSPSRLPPPLSGTAVTCDPFNDRSRSAPVGLPESSGSVHVPLREDSRSTPGALPVGIGIGMGIGEGSKAMRVSAAPPALEGAIADQSPGTIDEQPALPLFAPEAEANPQRPTPLSRTETGQGEAIDPGAGDCQGREHDRPLAAQARANAQTQPAPRKAVTPQGEAWVHWRDAIWPKLSSEPCPKPTQVEMTLLAGRCREFGAAGVTAAMDRAIGDDWWRARLDVKSFCSNFARFLPRVGPAPPRPRGMAPPSTDWTSPEASRL